MFFKIFLEGELFFQVAERTQKSSRKLASHFKAPQTITATWRGMRAEQTSSGDTHVTLYAFALKVTMTYSNVLFFTDAKGLSLRKRKIIHTLHAKHEMKVDANFFGSNEYM